MFLFCSCKTRLLVVEKFNLRLCRSARVRSLLKDNKRVASCFSECRRRQQRGCGKKRKSPAQAKNLAGQVSRPECALAAWAQQLSISDYDPPPGVSLLATLLNVVLALVPIA